MITGPKRFSNNNVIAQDNDHYYLCSCNSPSPSLQGFKNASAKKKISHSYKKYFVRSPLQSSGISQVMSS